MKRPSDVVGGDLPAFSHGGYGDARLHIVLRESFEQRLADDGILLAVHHLRVEIGRLGQISHVDDLLAVPGLDGGFAFLRATRPAEEQTASDEKRKNTGKI